MTKEKDKPEKRGGKRPGAGRKKGFAALKAEQAREFIAAELEKNLKLIVTRAIDQAKEGDKYARDWLSDRAWGKAPQTLSLEDGDGEGFQVVKILINQPDAKRTSNKSNT